jgi:hypothetical protein
LAFGVKTTSSFYSFTVLFMLFKIFAAIIELQTAKVINNEPRLPIQMDFLFDGATYSSDPNAGQQRGGRPQQQQQRQPPPQPYQSDLSDARMNPPSYHQTTTIVTHTRETADEKVMNLDADTL